MIVAGSALGVLLFFVLGALPIYGAGLGGFPLIYSLNGEGGNFGGPYPPHEPAFAVDFAFWVFVGIILLEIWDRKELHLVHRDEQA